MAQIVTKAVRDAHGGIFNMTFLETDDGNVYPLAGVGPEGTTDSRGLATDRPDPTTVIPGSTYWSIDTGAVEVSDGTDWIVV